MPLLLVAAGELAAAGVALERFLAGVGPDVCGEVVAAAEGPHADAALERLLARVDADVAGEFVAAAESPVAAVDGAGVRPLVQRGLGGAVGVLAWFHGEQLEGTALVCLAQNFMTLVKEERY